MKIKQIIIELVIFSLLATPVSAQEIGNTSSNENSNVQTSKVIQDPSTVLKITNNPQKGNSVTLSDYVDNKYNKSNAATVIDLKTFRDLVSSDQALLKKKTTDDFENSKIVMLCGDEKNKVDSMELFNLLNITCVNGVSITAADNAGEDSLNNIIASAVSIGDDGCIHVYNYMDITKTRDKHIKGDLLNDNAKEDNYIDTNNQDEVISYAINSFSKNSTLTESSNETTQIDKFTTQSDPNNGSKYKDLSGGNWDWIDHEEFHDNHCGNYIMNYEFNRVAYNNYNSIWTMRGTTIFADCVKPYAIGYLKVGYNVNDVANENCTEYSPTKEDFGGTCSVSLSANPSISYSFPVSNGFSLHDTTYTGTEAGWGFYVPSIDNSDAGNDITIKPAATFINSAGNFVVRTTGYMDFYETGLGWFRDQHSYWGYWTPGDFTYTFADRGCH